MKSVRILSCFDIPHLSQWWMDIKEKCSIDVPTCHFAKMCLVPAVTHFYLYFLLQVEETLSKLMKTHILTSMKALYFSILTLYLSSITDFL